MEFNIIDNPASWHEINAEWHALVESCAINMPFLSYVYQRNWWETLGGGEWPAENSFLRIITARKAGKLIGIAPLFLTQKEDHEPALHFIGSYEVSDYLDFIVSEYDSPEFIPALLNFLNQHPDPSLKRLDLFNILDSSSSLPIIREQVSLNHWEYREEIIQPSPYLTIPENWDQYMATLSKKYRHEIRRKLRRAEETELHCYVVTDPLTLDEEIYSFIDMMALDPEKEAFLTDTMRGHIATTAKIAFDQGWLHLAYLIINNEKAASYMNFLINNHLLIFNSAWNRNFSQYSPGWVLLAKVIKWAIKHNIKIVDFMRGDEAYKYQFGGVDRFVVRATLSL